MISTASSASRHHNLNIIWDASQAHGTFYQARDAGSFNDLVTYSFYPTKNMTTGGGEMVVTNDQELYERCRLLRAHGETRKYYHERFGLNYRMTEIVAALGLEQLRKLPTLTEQRHCNAAYLTERLIMESGITVP